MSATAVPFPTSLSSYAVVSGTWSIIGPQLDGVMASGAGLIITPPIVTDNYILEIPLRMLVASKLEAAIVFRFVNSSNFYWAGLGVYGRFLSIGKFINGVASEQKYAVDQNNVALPASLLVQDARYILKVVAEGAHIQVYVNNILYIDWTDPTSPILAGNIGFRIYSSHVQFAVSTSKITVKSLSPNGIDLNVEVYIDDTFVGYTPNSFPYEAGNHTVRTEAEVTR